MLIPQEIEIIDCESSSDEEQEKEGSQQHKESTPTHASDIIDCETDSSEDEQEVVAKQAAPPPAPVQATKEAGPSISNILVKKASKKKRKKKKKKKEEQIDDVLEEFAQLDHANAPSSDEESERLNTDKNTMMHLGCPYEIVHICPGHTGIFATRDILKNSTILSEVPLMVDKAFDMQEVLPGSATCILTPEDQIKAKALFAEFTQHTNRKTEVVSPAAFGVFDKLTEMWTDAKAAKLDAAKREEFWALHDCNTDAVHSEGTKVRIHGLRSESGRALNDRDAVVIKRAPPASDNRWKVMLPSGKNGEFVEGDSKKYFAVKGENLKTASGIQRTNSFKEGNENLLVTYSLISRFNHACVPNCRKMFVNSLDYLQVASYRARRVVAVEDIKKGDELFLCYSSIRSDITTHERRTALLDKYKFWCNCSECQKDACQCEVCQRDACQCEDCCAERAYSRGLQNPNASALLNNMR
jgi:hypothetical protein